MLAKETALPIQGGEVPEVESTSPASPFEPQPGAQRPGLSKAQSVVSSSNGGELSERERRRSKGQSLCQWSLNFFSRKSVLRATLILGLLAAAGICAGLAYRELRDSEIEVAVQTYNSIANSALFGAVDITRRKLEGSEVVKTLMSHSIPDASSWPFIEVAGYIPIAQSVAALSNSTTQAVMAFVEPEQRQDFEDHIKAVYEREGRPEGTGSSDFGFGVWKPDNENDPPVYEDKRWHDTTGEVEWGSTDTTMAVLSLHSSPGASSLMYNVYSEEDRGIHIESMRECSKRHEEALQSPGLEIPNCYAVTDMLELKIRPGPAALIFNPIYPANDPTAFVGFATTSLHWQETLTSTVPDYVDGLTCVVSTDTRSYTYEITPGGIPILVGDGDQHDPRYNKYARSQVLTYITSGAESSATYTLTVYPTDRMFSQFESNTPVNVAVSFVAVIAAVTCLFFLYDFLMRHEASERAKILEMKRRFVRFISHEIRTPLNTVCMGLELLESEMQDQQKNNKDATSLLGNGKEDTKEDMEFWSTVVDDIKENAHVAVSILNDLLNYDKLETGTMKLELDPVNIWDLASKTVQQFQIQAINRRVDMRFELVGKDTQEIVSTYDVEGAAYPKHTKDGKRVVGDAVRLGQVLRNIISNALKFTPAEGSVIVMAEYIKKGLSHAKPVMDGEYIACNHPRAGSVRITVTDSGVGLTAEQLSQLFAEGVQFDANKLQHGGGSGLGLNIAKGIVEQHQGVIHAESQGANTGTTFVIELPLYDFPSDEVTSEFSDESKGSNDCAPTEATSDVSDSQNHDTTGPIKILVAEDSTSSRKMLIRLLERSGYECVPAANGQEAVDVIQKDLAAYDKDPTTHQMIDTVLMDFEMPLVTGPEATKKIRRMGYKGLVIGVTGNVLDEDIEFFMQRGADDVMPKPVSLKGLKSVWSKLAAASEGTGMKKSPSAQRLDDYVA